jgi:hypothetical protein
VRSSCPSSSTGGDSEAGRGDGVFPSRRRNNPNRDIRVAVQPHEPLLRGILSAGNTAPPCASPSKPGTERKQGSRGFTCGSKLRLEVDHVVPRGRGGPSTIDICHLTCAMHNQLAARQVYGDEWMDRFTLGTGISPVTDQPDPDRSRRGLMLSTKHALKGRARVSTKSPM